MKKYLISILFITFFLPFFAFASDYSNGTLLKADNDVKVYVIQNNQKRWIKTADIFNSYNFKWVDIKSVSQTILDSLPDNNLIKSDNDPSVYIITNGYKRHIPSPLVFESYGLKWENINQINQTEMNAYTESSLIKTAADSKVYALENSTKRWIPDAETFYKNSYKWEAIQVVNDTEINSYWTGTNKDIPTTSESAESTANTESTTNTTTTTTTTTTTPAVVGSIYIISSKTSIPADKKSTIDFEILVKDTNGAVMPNQIVYVVIGNSTSAYQTNSSGIANVSYLSTGAVGTKTITANIGAVSTTKQISETAYYTTPLSSANVIFYAGATNGGYCLKDSFIAEGYIEQADGTLKHSTKKDTLGNPLTICDQINMPKYSVVGREKVGAATMEIEVKGTEKVKLIGLSLTQSGSFTDSDYKNVKLAGNWYGDNTYGTAQPTNNTITFDLSQNPISLINAQIKGELHISGITSFFLLADFLASVAGKNFQFDITDIQLTGETTNKTITPSFEKTSTNKNYVGTVPYNPN